MFPFQGRIGRSLRKGKARGGSIGVTRGLEMLETRMMLSGVSAAPTGVVATGVSPSSITVTWKANADTAVTGYDVFERIFIKGIGGKGSHPGHYVYNTIATNLTATTDTITGLVGGTFHTYVVAAVDPAGVSGYSALATAETWVAPTLSLGNAFLLSNGAVFSSPVDVTAGQIVQVKMVAAGSPVSYALVSGPSNATVNATTGLLTFRTGAADVGTVPITLKAFNTLGTVTQTISFNVNAADPSLLAPKITLSGTSLTYNGQNRQVSATVVGTDGVTPVAGTVVFAYKGSPTLPHDVGTYGVLATFTSADPAYANATLLMNMSIYKATPVFSSLTQPTIAIGEATAVVSAHLATGAAYPTGDAVTVTLNGIKQSAIVDSLGNITTTFDTAALALGPHTVTYAFVGDANFNASATASGTLNVIPTAVPKITKNPVANIEVTAGDPVSFTATASGSPTPTVQWQYSSDGGLTFTNVTSNVSATTTSLVINSTLAMNGYRFRAVFTNSVGTAISAVSVLTVTAF